MPSTRTVAVWPRMITMDEVRAAALALPATSERAAPRGGHPQFVTNGKCFAELRTWPELTERGVGDFAAGGRAVLHFHHSETSRHADVKRGLGWGDPIPFPLGRPSAKVQKDFYAEVRQRLAVTLEEIESAKRQRRSSSSR